jgi:hypothetical protein
MDNEAVRDRIDAALETKAHQPAGKAAVEVGRALRLAAERGLRRWARLRDYPGTRRVGDGAATSGPVKAIACDGVSIAGNGAMNSKTLCED